MRQEHRARRRPLRFAVLGPLRVVADREIPIERPAQRRLLAILLLEAGRRLDADVLIDRFWGEEAPATARAALQTHISQLRKRLGDGIITTTAEGYQLGLEGHSLDLTEFDAAARSAGDAYRRGAWSDVVDQAALALGLWRGPPFRELQDDAYPAPTAARLEELRAELIEMRAEAQLALGDNEHALPDLERFVHEYPYRERLWLHLMLARARLGRTADALAAYHQARAAFEELGLEPGPSMRELEGRILREDPSLVPPRIRHNLPAALTSFVGRDAERADLAGLLVGQRLVTLTGVGGVGKTRLALRVAEDVIKRYPDGVWLVDLAPLSAPDQITGQVAMAIGLRGDRRSMAETLRRALRGRRTLIVLDNCEHLLPAASEVAHLLLAAGRGVSLLATSRTPLGATGERVFAVRPLPTPESHAMNDAELAAYEAVRLFADRAALAASDFAVGPDNLTTIASICRRLDGLPLAIELAAAQMSALAPEDVADRLDNRFRLLTRNQPTTPPRHQTLEATVAWSYDHLSDVERRLFARLAVFRGPFDLASVEAICFDETTGQERVAAVLAALVDRSLVVPMDTPAGRRYRLLETIRQYAVERLNALEDANEARRRHRDHCLDFATERLAAPAAFTWIEPMRERRDDVEAALAWSLAAGDRPESAMLAATLAAFWDVLGLPRRAVAQARDVLERCDVEADPERAADVHTVLGSALFSVGDTDGAVAESRRAVDLVNDRPPSPEKLSALGEYAALLRLSTRHDPADAVPPAEEALAVAHALDEQRALRYAHIRLGGALAWSGRIDEGLVHHRQALHLAEQLGSPPAIIASYTNLMTQVWLHPEKRRTEPARLAHEIVSRFGADTSLDGFMPWGWIGYSLLLSGEWDRTERAVERMARLGQEGFELTHLRHVRGCLRWMQGRLGAAAEEMTAATEAPDLSDRWFHDVFDLQAAVAADRGDLNLVRRSAATYLAAPVHAAEESMKSVVLRSLVRAEVDAALAGDGAAMEKHARRAREAFEQMRELLRRYPHPTGGTVQLEGARFNLIVSEAEISRLTTPSPELWEAAEGEASYAYWKLYAAWRRAEALLAAGSPQGTAALHDAHRRASSVGASLLRHRLEELAASHGVPLPPGAPVPPG